MPLPLTRTRQASALEYPRPRGGRLELMPEIHGIGEAVDVRRFAATPEVQSVAGRLSWAAGRIVYRPCKAVAEGETGDTAVPLIDGEGNVLEVIDPRLAEDCADIWSQVRSPLGRQSDLWRSLVWSLGVSADGWLFSYPAAPDLTYDPEAARVVWLAVGRPALKRQGEFYILDVGTGLPQRIPAATPERPGGRAIRVWDPDPDAPARARSWLHSCVRSLEILVGIYEAVGATALTALNAGLILTPDDQDKHPTQATGYGDDHPATGRDTPLFEQLFSLVGDHVEKSAAEMDGISRVLPPTIGMNSDLIDKVKWLEIARTLDPELGSRIDDLRKRVAIACPLPPEIMLGLGDSVAGIGGGNVADQITEDEFRMGHASYCELVSSATTTYILRAGLLSGAAASGNMWPFDVAATVQIGYDASALTRPLDRSQRAVELGQGDNPILAHQEVREACGMGEFSGPDEEETQVNRILRLMEKSPDYAYLGPLVGLPEPPTTNWARTPDPDPAAANTAETGAVAQASAISVPSRELPAAAPDVGALLTAIGSRFEDRLAVLADAMAAAMADRAGGRVVVMSRQASWASVRQAVAAAPRSAKGSPAGVAALLAASGSSDDELFGGAALPFAERFASLTSDAQASAVSAAGGEWAAVSADGDAAGLAAWVLLVSLLLAESRRRFEGRSLEDGTAMAAAPVPIGLVRRVSAVAGGDPDPGQGAGVIGRTTSACMTIATGSLVLGVLTNRGAEVTGWTWIHDSPENPYPDHDDLDGETSGLDKDFSGFFPSDHAGCLCVLQPIIGEPSEVAA